MVINVNRFIKKSLFFVIIYTMFVNFICNFFNVSRLIKYIPDLMIPIFILYIFTNFNKIINNKYTRTLFFIILLFFIHCIISLAINFQSIFYFVWGFRNIFRFFIFMLCLIINFDKSDIYRLKKFFDKLFIINLIFVLIEFLVFKLYGDSVGGIFGIFHSGGNGPLLYFIVIETVICVNEFMQKKVNFSHLVFIIVSSLICATLAELKAYYFFLIFIIVIDLLLNKFTLKTILTIMLSFVALLMSFKVLSIVSPNSAKILEPENIEKSLIGGYSSNDGISRFNAFSDINKYFFNDNSDRKLYGYGLGNCDTSVLSLFNTRFSVMYDNTYHYTWFMDAMLYLETGLIGFSLYILFLVWIIICSFKFRKDDNENSFLHYSVCAMTLLLFIFIVYDSVLRTDASYFVYTFLTFPFILSKKSKEQKYALEV